MRTSKDRVKRLEAWHRLRNVHTVLIVKNEGEPDETDEDAKRRYIAEHGDPGPWVEWVFIRLTIVHGGAREDAVTAF